MTACADFRIPHIQPLEHEHLYGRFQGYIVGRGPPVPSNDGPGFCNAGKWFVRAGRAVPGVLGLGVCHGERSGIELRDDVLWDMVGCLLLRGGSDISLGSVVVSSQHE